MNNPSTAPSAKISNLLGDEGDRGGVEYSKTLKVSGWKPAARD